MYIIWVHYLLVAFAFFVAKSIPNSGPKVF